MGEHARCSRPRLVNVLKLVLAKGSEASLNLSHHRKEGRIFRIFAMKGEVPRQEARFLL